jgi:general secretion pathway protein E/type IV pilus assembly protein PilB
VAEKDDYLLDLLVDLGFTTADVVAKAREEAHAAGVGVVDLLVANGLIRAGDVTQAKAAQFGAEVVHLANMKIEDDVIAIVPRDIAKKYRVIPVFKNDGKIGIAIADPSDLNTIDSLTHLLNAEIEPRVASETDIEAALVKYYGSGEKKKMDAGIFAGVMQELTEENVHVAKVEDGGEVEADAPLIRLVNFVCATALTACCRR